MSVRIQKSRRYRWIRIRLRQVRIRLRPDCVRSGLGRGPLVQGQGQARRRGGRHQGRLWRGRGGHRGRYRYIHNMMYRIRIRLNWVRGRGLAAAKGNHMARKAGRKFGSASRLELNFQ